jgi:cold shock CspA family protein
MVTAEELADPEEYRDILSDVREECTRVGGDVASVTIPRLDDLSAQPPALPPSVDAIGLVFVEFEGLDAAEKARSALDGRTFGENLVSVFPYPESDYAQGVLTDVRVALPAADEPAVDGAPRRRTGVVRMWNVDKGFGFVQESDGTDLFVHVRSLVAHSSSAALDIGQCVSYRVETQPDGRDQAVDVRDPGGELPVDEAAHQAALAAAQV